jgi:hypothetical protein
MSSNDVKEIVVISDGTGRTARRLMDAVLVQYSGHPVAFRVKNTYTHVRTAQQLDSIMPEINSDDLVIFSIISDDLRTHFHDRLHELDILHLNVLEPMLSTMSKFLGFHPEYKPGLLQIIDDRYYRRVDAIGFTVEHDDGLGRQIGEADLVIVGPSRTCKTPISMYLACNYGLKVANIPIVAEDQMKSSLIERLNCVEKNRVIGLVMRAEVLARVRQERSEFLSRGKAGREAMASYIDLHQVRREVKFVRALCDNQDWEVIDVTRRAIEEVSSEIVRSHERNFGSTAELE